jgi:gliding motility-associated-like protein
MVYRYLICSLFILLSFTSTGQIDKEFWFAVPYANPTNGRIPVFLRIQAYSLPATITINIPANPGFTGKTITLNANQATSLDLSSWLTNLENKTENTVLNRGLHIVSTNEISVYYELYGSSNYAPGTNSDLFPLKGRNALGTSFFTPFQTTWDNQIDIDAWASFDIVATEDSTQIKITPAQNIVGHQASVPFTITLNKGQTWSGRALLTDAVIRPTGTTIQSTKPIAVTVKDDSMLKDDSWDLGGDQIVPIDQLGTEYIIMKHANDSLTDNDNAYILAIAPNTDIFTGGNSTPVATLQTGEQLEISITETLYLTASNPVYIIHVTGFGNELAEAILPQINCTGSKELGFIRSNDEDLVLNILTKAGNEGNFTLNNKTTLIQASDFKTITGTTQWLYASKLFSITDIPELKANLLQNSSGYFHLSVMNGSADRTGFRYGFFSDFGFVDLGPDQTMCPGSKTELSAGIQKDSYLWSTGETTSTIIAKDSGTYSVIVTKEQCSFKDTVHISLYPHTGKIIINKDDSICAYQHVVINTNSNYHDFVWSTSEKTDSITVSKQGNYSVTANNQYGCANTDSVKITVLPSPQGSIVYSPANDIDFCNTELSLVDLTAPPNFKSYLWYNAQTTQTIQTPRNDNGIYSVKVTNNYGCEDTITAIIDCSTYIEVYNLITPNGDTMNDFFEVKGLLPNTYALKIYNSWGALVYSDDAYNNVWKGKPLEDGVYYYSLIHHQGKRNLKGWLHVVR